MKRVKILLIISLMFSLSGCILKEKDISQLIFPITMVLSKKGEKYQIHMLVLSNSLSSKIELESGLDDNLYTTIAFEGDTISEASEKIGVVTNGNLSAIKIRSIIIHDSIFKDSSLNYHDITSYLINNPLYRTNIYAYYTKEDPDKILNINSLNYTTNTYFYLSRPDQKHLNDFLLPSSLLNSAKSYVDNKRMFYLPSLKISTEQLKQENEGELKEVNSYKLDGGYFLTRDDNFKFVEMEKLEGLKWKSGRDYFDIDLGDKDSLLNVKIEKLKWKTSIKDNQIHVDINVISKINYNYTGLNAKEVENKLKDFIYNEVMETYYYNYKDIDIYLFDDLSYRLNKNIANRDTFNLNINATIKNTIYEY